MKKYVVTASLMAGLSMVSGAAFAQTGSVGANYTRVDTDFGDADAYGVDGEVIFSTGGTWSAIVDGSYIDSDAADGTLSATGHLITSGANNAWGGFAGVSDSDGSTVYFVGGEYAQYFNTTTLAFNVNYANDDDNDVDAWGLNAAYRIFASDNLRFDLGASFARADSGGVDGDITSFGAGLEYRFDNSPFSIGAAYSRLGGDVPDADVIGVTLRWNFGDATLKEADRKGKTFTSLGNALSSF